MNPYDYIERKKKADTVISETESQLSKDYDLVIEGYLPDNLRPANAKDIVVGNVIWYPRWDYHKWVVIEEVLYPNDAFKAFIGDGCRYGLDGAFVDLDRSVNKQSI
jgi:hypothetical protein